MAVSKITRGNDKTKTVHPLMDELLVIGNKTQNYIAITDERTNMQKKKHQRTLQKKRVCHMLHLTMML